MKYYPGCVGISKKNNIRIPIEQPGFHGKSPAGFFVVAAGAWSGAFFTSLKGVAEIDVFTHLWPCESIGKGGK